MKDVKTIVIKKLIEDCPLLTVLEQVKYAVEKIEKEGGEVQDIFITLTGMEYDTYWASIYYSETSLQIA